MTSSDPPPASFYEIQTRTGWGRTLEAVAAWCRAEPGWLALDLGSGPGLLPALLAKQGVRTVGLDLDRSAFEEGRLYPDLVQGEACFSPFASQSFHLVSAVNLLFLLPDPLPTLREIRRLLLPGGQAVVLNPSENLSVAAAASLADQRGLQGAARQSLLNWARLAEAHSRWTESELLSLFAAAGLRVSEFHSLVGNGFARLTRAVSG
jgi:SAM-dependent methyltransferase